MLEPQIVEKPALSVVGMQASFIHALSADATNFKVIGPLWGRFVDEARDVPNRGGHDMYGIIFGRPEAVRSHPHELEYIACVPVSGPGEIPAGMVAHSVPAGKFAVFVHHGPITEIATTCREIYRVWLPQSGYEHSGIADVELYDERFCPDGAESEMEFWISVRETAAE